MFPEDFRAENMWRMKKPMWSMRYPFIILMNSHLIPKMINNEGLPSGSPFYLRYSRKPHPTSVGWGSSSVNALISPGCKRITLLSLCHLICVQLYMHVQIPRWNCRRNLLLRLLHIFHLVFLPLLFQLL